MRRVSTRAWSAWVTSPGRRCPRSSWSGSCWPGAGSASSCSARGSPCSAWPGPPWPGGASAPARPQPRLEPPPCPRSPPRPRLSPGRRPWPRNEELMTGPRRSGPSEGGAARALTTAELGRLLAGRNDTARDVPEATLAGLFEAQAARVPDAVAVACGAAVLSYAELDGRAGRLAAYLTSLGAGPDRLVAVAMDRSAEVFVAWLGVAKSGAAFLPVDPGYPAERIGFMLADAQPDLVG